MGFSSLWLGQKKLSISFIGTTALHWNKCYCHIKKRPNVSRYESHSYTEIFQVSIFFTQLSKSLIFLYIVRFDFQTSMNVFCIDPVRTGPRVTTVLGPTPVAVPRDGRAKTVIQVQHQWHHHTNHFWSAWY